ncbi:YihY/virulence factor BrkB family protein [Haloglomus salinum]|jgi:membrane protein|uniref:YihY/virulence factor BrkB family protein n=1 Tax=Haloglomus salinum TaxID=2962673 RepID=UPI0020C9E99B|nr:YhjD/YihY/BrkB family envelope integrity protein [Haloglomus salinum]
MNQRASRLADVTRTTVRAVRSDQITFIAASLSYYAFISLIPLLLLAIVTASVFGGEQLAAGLADRAATAFGDQAGDAVRGALTSAAGQGGATLVGLAVLLWSGLKLFRGMDVAFSTVYGAPLPEGIIEQVRDAFITLVAVGLGIAATVLLGFLIAQVDIPALGIDLANVIGTLLLVVGLAAAFFPLYYFLPAQNVTPREALPGALFAAVGWTALQTGFRVYAAGAGTSAYGVLGAALLLVTFLYFGALILLVGVALNAANAGRLAEDDIETEMESIDSEKRDSDMTERDTELNLDIDTEELDDEELRRAVEGLREDLADFEERIDDRTVHREEITDELKHYVRGQVRKGKARGWGPYLVLLYGTAMTLGAFYLLGDIAAVLAMFVIWLSTLGLYTLMLLVGAGVGAARAPGRMKDRIDEFRS